MENRTIKALDVSDFRILKQISIVTQNHYGIDISIGNLLYERKFTDDYKFNEIESTEKKYKFYIDYPTQEMFPNDDADDLILQAVKNSYPNSVVKNHSIIFNVDLEKIPYLKRGELLNTNIILSPEFPSFTNISDFVNIKFEVKSIPISIYSNNSSYFVSGQNLFGKYESSDSEVINKLSDIEFI